MNNGDWMYQSRRWSHYRLTLWKSTLLEAAIMCVATAAIVMIVERTEAGQRYEIEPMHPAVEIASHDRQQMDVSGSALRLDWSLSAPPDVDDEQRESEPSDLSLPRLRGTVGGTPWQAVVTSMSGMEEVIVITGDTINGWMVKEIRDGSVVVTKGEHRLELRVEQGK